MGQARTATEVQPCALSSAAVVLVVEDEVLVRMAIALELSDSGYEVIEAADAVAALAVLEEGRRVDLIFSDVQMPGPVNGLGLRRSVRERYPHIPVILTSAHFTPPDDGGAGSGPAFIPKPYLPATVLGAVRSRIGSADERHGAAAG